MATATRAARRNAATATSRPPTSIGAKARAAAAALRSTASEHLSPAQFGRHRAATPSYGANRANAMGGSSHQPQHGYNPRHASGFESAGTGTSNGRHANWFSSK